MNIPVCNAVTLVWGSLIEKLTPTVVSNEATVNAMCDVLNKSFLCYRTCYWNLRTLKPMRRYAVHCRYISMYYFQDNFGTCVYVYTCMHHRVCIIGCLPQSFLKSPPTCTVCAHVIPHSRKLSREKTFANFAVLWLLAKVFSAKLGGVVPLALQK